MKKFFTILLSLIFISLLGCNQQEDVNKGVVKDGVFVHISHGSDNLHRALMGLQFAEKMSVDRDVLVYFDITGIEIVLKDAPDYTYSHFPSSKTQLKALLEGGVTIMACPGCLKAADKTEEDLMEGIKVADKAEFFNFTEGRILSIDY